MRCAPKIRTLALIANGLLPIPWRTKQPRLEGPSAAEVFPSYVATMPNPREFFSYETFDAGLSNSEMIRVTTGINFTATSLPRAIAHAQVVPLCRDVEYTVQVQLFMMR